MGWVLNILDWLWAKFIAWSSYALDILRSVWAKLVPWGTYALDILHSCWTNVAAWVVGHFTELGSGIRDRLTEANAFKVVLLIIVLLLTLRTVGSKNGIKGSQEWPRLKVQIDDKLLDQQVRLPRGNFVPRSDAKKSTTAAALLYFVK